MAVQGPAFIHRSVTLAPGNFANFAGGARFGHLLLWVNVAVCCG
jgi:Mn2+/Fe2+ NRAMP family transporter